MPQNCIGANLARLRLDRGLTQAALASRAGISRLAVGKIERGASIPRTRTLDDLAEALGASLSDLVTPVRPLRRVRFRARAGMHGREQILAEVSKWLDGYRMLEDELDDRRPFGFGPLPAPGEPRDPAEAARTARAAAGLPPGDPAPDLCGLLEERGVKVLLTEKKRDWFFGLSVGPSDGGPAVVVNTWRRISVERWIFTAAHELGHLLLHDDQYDPETDDHPLSSEAEADAFAGEFLMPEAGFGPAWSATRGLSLVERVLRVKHRFRVSYRTVLRRLVESGREESEVWHRFREQYAARSGRTLTKTEEPQGLPGSAFARPSPRAEEPAALPDLAFRENRLSRLVREALEGQRITLSHAAEIMGMRLLEVRDWIRSWAA